MVVVPLAEPSLAAGIMEDREIYELRQVCTAGGLSQDALGALIDSNLSVPSLVRSEAAAMASAKKAGLGLADRQKLREALRKHKDEVLSAEQPKIVEIGDDAEVRTHWLGCAGDESTAKENDESWPEGGSAR